MGSTDGCTHSGMFAGIRAYNILWQWQIRLCYACILGGLDFDKLINYWRPSTSKKYIFRRRRQTVSKISL